MNLECPACGSRNTRIRSTRGFFPRLKRLLGVYPARCRDCQHTFGTSIWNLRRIWYAHCPKCMRYELTRWNEEYRRPPVYNRLKLLLGAHRYRCEFCRVNFASFRRARKIYTWKQYQQMRRTSERENDPTQLLI